MAQVECWMEQLLLRSKRGEGVMSIFDIPQRCKANPHFDELYPLFCDEMGLADALRMDDEAWADKFEKYVEKKGEEVK